MESSVSLILTRRVRGNQPGYLFLTHHNSEPLLAVRHHLVLPLIGRTSQVRKIYDNGLLTFCLTSKSVDTAGPLLDVAGVPVEIMVNNVPAKSLQINTLSHNLAAH